MSSSWRLRSSEKVQKAIAGQNFERAGAKLMKEKIQPLTSLPIEIIKHQEFFKVKIGPIRNSTRLKMLRDNIRNQYNISPFILWP